MAQWQTVVTDHPALKVIEDESFLASCHGSAYWSDVFGMFACIAYTLTVCCWYCVSMCTANKSETDKTL